MKKRTTLWSRLKPEHKQTLANEFADRPFTHECIVEALNNEFFFTEVKYGIVYDITSSCDLEFFGDAFKIETND